MTTELTRIHLNAGVSERFTKWLTSEYPKTSIDNSITYGGDYSYIETSLQGDELEAFLNKLKLRYPYEKETIL